VRRAQVAGGFVFAEGPRWHDGRLWVADQHAHRVFSISTAGEVTIVLELDDLPSGLGFLPDGSLLVACMRSQRVLRRGLDGGVTTHAELAGLGAGWLNDMVVDTTGRAYLDFNRGRLYGRVPDEPDAIALVDPDGRPRLVAGDLRSPNGMAVTEDGGTLVVAEFRGNRLLAFEIGSDGSLTQRRTFAELGSNPDGICLDAEAAAWLGSPNTAEFLRVREGGEVVQRVPTEPGRGIACVLGGPARQTLFMVVAEMPEGAMLRLRDSDDPGQDHLSGARSWIEAVGVDVPGAGIP
jgi:sugar lactone lactonase YvrE